MFDNLRYAIRQILRARTLAIVIVLTLALGVGANTAIFSAIQVVLLHPSGVRDPEQFVSFHTHYKVYWPGNGANGLDAHWRLCR